jgi:predicted AAA+ superfamily ATPase
MWIERSFEGALLRSARQRPVVAVTGARQTGKTSLLKRLFPGHRYVSLDLPAEAHQAENDPANFLKLNAPPLILDEVQYAPGLFRHLKQAVDGARSKRGQFLLTGSQKFTLMKGVSDSLAGRIEIFELESLAVQEIQRSLPGSSLTSILLRGGFPELYEDLDLSPSSFYRSYVATYLERDLRALINVTRLRDFERFIRACALRSAQLLNKVDLARDVGISPSTANEWLSALAASNQIVLLEPWFSNRTKSLVKSPKMYLADTGLLAFLLNIRTEEELLKSPMIGALWETFVCSELRKRLAFDGAEGSLHFWRDRTREVDFLIHRGGRFELLEAKWAEIPQPQDSANLEFVTAALPAKSVTSRTIVCRTPTAYRVKDGPHVRPLSDPFPS